MDPRPIILADKRTTDLVDCEMIAQFVVMQLQELLPGYPIVGRDAKSSFEEKEALV